MAKVTKLVEPVMLTDDALDRMLDEVARLFAAGSIQQSKAYFMSCVDLSTQASLNAALARSPHFAKSSGGQK